MSEYPRLALPIRPPFAPMEAKPARKLPEKGAWRYEPKWDGFRCLLFRDGAAVALQSKNGLPLARYFPELVAAALALPIDRFVLDGEIVVPRRDRPELFSFNDLQQRMHPAASRVQRLAGETPSKLLVFDVLVIDAVSLEERTNDERRAALEALAPRAFAGQSTFELSPQTTSLEDAQVWMRGPGGGEASAASEPPGRWSMASAATTDGVIAKRRDMTYRAGERDGMVKVKRIRTLDCVVGGFRYGMSQNKMTKLVGSLLLGLYDDEGRLHHVGHTSTVPRKEKAEVTARLEAMRAPVAFVDGGPGGPSRWTRSEEKSAWEPVRPELVVEVSYDHWSGGRMRHGSKFERWRPDKDARACTYDQVPAASDDEGSCDEDEAASEEDGA